MRFLSSLIFAASVTIGQTEEPADPHLQQLARLVGTWTVAYDVPDMPIKEARVTYRWTLGGKYLEARWCKTDGTDLGPELFTWDPISKTIKMWGFDTESFYETTWQIDDKKWTGKYAGTKFTGQRTNDTLIVEFDSDSTGVLKSIPEGSDKTTVIGRFTRVDAEPVDQPAGRQHLDAFAKDFAGEWVSESVADDDLGPVKKGQKFNAYHSYKWSPDKEALLLTYSAEINGRTFDTTKGIAGWDAARKAIVVRWFDSLGATGEFAVTKVGQGWHYSWISTDAEGEEYTWTGTITFAPGIQRAHDTNRKIKGQAMPDQETTWKRRS